MTTTVTIHQTNLPDVSIGVTDAALKQARYKFNPSALPAVDRIKLLTAALYSELDALTELTRAKVNDGASGDLAAVVGREVAVAKTQLQGAAMWAVSAATAHLS